MVWPHIKRGETSLIWLTSLYSHLPHFFFPLVGWQWEDSLNQESDRNCLQLIPEQFLNSYSCILTLSKTPWSPGNHPVIADVWYMKMFIWEQTRDKYSCFHFTRDPVQVPQVNISACPVNKKFLSLKVYCKDGQTVWKTHSACSVLAFKNMQLLCHKCRWKWRPCIWNFQPTDFLHLQRRRDNKARD